jgi:hypothetical protein
MPATLQPPVLRQPNPRAGVRTVTRQEAPTLLPSKLLLDGHSTRHDAHQEARFARTLRHAAICSMRHDCKPPLLSL